jgi:hypothetical protein
MAGLRHRREVPSPLAFRRARSAAYRAGPRNRVLVGAHSVGYAKAACKARRVHCMQPRGGCSRAVQILISPSMRVRCQYSLIAGSGQQTILDARGPELCAGSVSRLQGLKGLRAICLAASRTQARTAQRWRAVLAAHAQHAAQTCFRQRQGGGLKQEC